PQLGEKPLIDRAREILRAERSTRPAGEGTEHTLDELYMVEPPEAELLLVLEQCFREEEQRGGPLAHVECLEPHAARAQQGEEKLLQRRSRQRALHERRNLAVLSQHLHEVRIAQPRRGLDGAELHALRSARAAEVAAKLGEVLRRKRLERGELRRDDAHERVDASHAEERELRFATRQDVDQCIELV